MSVQERAAFRAPEFRPCPICQQNNPIESTKCQYCHTDLVIGWPQNYYIKGCDEPEETKVIVKVQVARGPAGPCAGAIISPSPDGSGMGVWVLSQEDDQACVYDYAGGIV